MIIGLFVVSVAALVIFVLVELRAAEPILPMRLFRSRVFSVCSVAQLHRRLRDDRLDHLPAHVPAVRERGIGHLSGLRMLPMVLALLVTALGSGIIVSRTGRYRLFPIAGRRSLRSACSCCPGWTQHSSIWVETGALLVLGAGIGLIMQILTLVVQNTVPYSDLARPPPA